MIKYYVEGGIFTDTSFDKLEPNTLEKYGPFNTYEEAKTIWQAATFCSKLDICGHRLFIIREEKS